MNSLIMDTPLVERRRRRRRKMNYGIYLDGIFGLFFNSLPPPPPDSFVLRNGLIDWLIRFNWSSPSMASIRWPSWNDGFIFGLNHGHMEEGRNSLGCWCCCCWCWILIFHIDEEMGRANVIQQPKDGSINNKMADGGRKWNRLISNLRC